MTQREEPGPSGLPPSGFEGRRKPPVPALPQTLPETPVGSASHGHATSPSNELGRAVDQEGYPAAVMTVASSSTGAPTAAAAAAAPTGATSPAGAASTAATSQAAASAPSRSAAPRLAPVSVDIPVPEPVFQAAATTATTATAATAAAAAADTSTIAATTATEADAARQARVVAKARLLRPGQPKAGPSLPPLPKALDGEEVAGSAEGDPAAVLPIAAESVAAVAADAAVAATAPATAPAAAPVATATGAATSAATAAGAAAAAAAPSTPATAAALETEPTEAGQTEAGGPSPLQLLDSWLQEREHQQRQQQQEQQQQQQKQHQQQQQPQQQQQQQQQEQQREQQKQRPRPTTLQEEASTPASAAKEQQDRGGGSVAATRLPSDALSSIGTTSRAADAPHSGLEIKDMIGQWDRLLDKLHSVGVAASWQTGDLPPEPLGPALRRARREALREKGYGWAAAEEFITPEQEARAQPSHPSSGPKLLGSRLPPTLTEAELAARGLQAPGSRPKRSMPSLTVEHFLELDRRATASRRLTERLSGQAHEWLLRFVVSSWRAGTTSVAQRTEHSKLEEKLKFAETHVASLLISRAERSRERLSVWQRLESQTMLRWTFSAWRSDAVAGTRAKVAEALGNVFGVGLDVGPGDEEEEQEEDAAEAAAATAAAAAAAAAAATGQGKERRNNMTRTTTTTTATLKTSEKEQGEDKLASFQARISELEGRLAEEAEARATAQARSEEAQRLLGESQKELLGTREALLAAREERRSAMAEAQAAQRELWAKSGSNPHPSLAKNAALPGSSDGDRGAEADQLRRDLSQVRAHIEAACSFLVEQGAQGRAKAIDSLHGILERYPDPQLLL